LIDGVVRNVVIAATLSRLGVRCRETLERFYLNGETAVSIAESRDTSSGYIWRLLNYCRNRARALQHRAVEGAAILDNEKYAVVLRAGIMILALDTVFRTAYRPVRVVA
jgi:hypothetical protein